MKTVEMSCCYNKEQLLYILMISMVRNRYCRSLFRAVIKTYFLCNELKTLLSLWSLFVQSDMVKSYQLYTINKEHKEKRPDCKFD